MGIVEESSGRFQDTRNANGPGSEEITEFVPGSLYEAFFYHHRSFRGTDEHIVSAYIYDSGFHFESNGKRIRSEKSFRKPAGVESDFRFRLYHKGFDIGEKS